MEAYLKEDKITETDFLNRFLELHTQDEDDIIDRRVYAEEYTTKRNVILQGIKLLELVNKQSKISDHRLLGDLLESSSIV